MNGMSEVKVIKMHLNFFVSLRIDGRAHLCLCLQGILKGEVSLHCLPPL